MISSKSCIFFISSLIFGYLNIGFSDNVGQPLVPRIWPNISDSGSFLQWPGIMGSGGLNISLYDAFAKIVNASGGNFGIPIFGVGNFTLLQIALIKAIGAIVAGAAAFIAEAIIIKKNHEAQLTHDGTGYGAPSLYVPNSYGAPPSDPYPSDAYHIPSSNSYSPPNKYGPPSPPNRYGPPSPPNKYGPPPPPNKYGPPSPPNKYGPPSPPNTYGAPPPSDTYGAPPPSDTYGAPPPSDTYGALPPSDTYGAPPPSDTYGHPPPSDSYGSPSPSNSYG